MCWCIDLDQGQATFYKLQAKTAWLRRFISSKELFLCLCSGQAIGTYSHTTAASLALCSPAVVWEHVSTDGELHQDQVPANCVQAAAASSHSPSSPS